MGDRLRRAWRHVRAREHGQTLVVVAVMIVGLIAILALVIDGGNVYAERRRLQNAADAGALAGARALASKLGEAAAYAAADQFTAQNGAQSWTTSIAGRRVRVTAFRTLPMNFAQVIGIATIDVQATAEAEWYPAIPSVGLVPLAVEDDVVRANLWMQIFDSPNTTTDLTLGQIGNGQRGWVDLNNNGVPAQNEITCWISRGYPCPGSGDPPIYLPGNYYGSEGTMTAALHAIDSLPVGPDGKKVIFVPVYDYLWYDGNQVFYHLLGFAPFAVSAVIDQGNPKMVQGYFMSDYIVPEGLGEAPADYGVRSVHLVH